MSAGTRATRNVSEMFTQIYRMCNIQCFHNTSYTRISMDWREQSSDISSESCLLASKPRRCTTAALAELPLWLIELPTWTKIIYWFLCQFCSMIFWFCSKLHSVPNLWTYILRLRSNKQQENRGLRQTDGDVNSKLIIFTFKLSLVNFCVKVKVVVAVPLRSLRFKALIGTTTAILVRPNVAKAQTTSHLAFRPRYMYKKNI